MDIPTIHPGGPTAARTNATIDQLADAMVEKFIMRISPLAHYRGAMYGNTPLTVEQQIHCLSVASHAVTYCTIANQGWRRRLAMQGLRNATDMIGNRPMSIDQIGQVATLCAELAEAVADSYQVEAES